MEDKNSGFKPSRRWFFLMSATAVSSLTGAFTSVAAPAFIPICAAAGLFFGIGAFINNEIEYKKYNKQKSTLE